MEEKSLVKKTFGVMVVTVLAKLLAFVRTAVCAALFGATWQTDAFYMATNIISLLSGLSNSLQVAIVPIRTQVLDERGKEEADVYASTLINFTIILSIVLGVIGYLLAPDIVHFFAPEFSGETYQITFVMLRIFLPVIAFMTVSYILSGVLNTHGRFVASHLVGIALNIGWMGIPLLLVRQWGIYAMVAGYVLGVALQIVIQWPYLKRVYRYLFVLHWKTTYFSKTLFMSVPVLIGTMATVISQAVDKALASGLAEGSVSALGYSIQLIGVVSGIIIVPIATTIFTSFSQMAQTDKVSEMKALVIRSCCIMSLILLPVTLISIVFSMDIVRIVFQRGAFDAQASFLTNDAFFYYAIGFLPIGLVNIFIRCFYALQNTRTPLIISIASVVVGIVLNLILVQYMQLGGLALATSIETMLSALAMMLALKRKIGAMGYLQWVKDMIKMVLALIPMAIISILTQRYIPAGALTKLILATAIGGIAYMGILLLLKQQDAQHAKQIIVGVLRKNLLRQR